MKVILVAEPAALGALPGEFARPAVSLPPVDWSQEAALVVDMGERRTGGYGVAVTGASQAGNGEIELTLDVRQPGRGDFVAQVITHPYAVTKVPRMWLAAGAVTVVGRDQHGNEVIRQVVQL